MAAEAKRIPGNLEIYDLAANGSHVAVVGFFTGTTALDTCQIQSTGQGSDGMLLTFLGTTLACQWGKGFGDSTNDLATSARGVAAHPDGGWVMTGAFTGNVNFAGSGTGLSSRGDSDIFLVRDDAAGTHIFSLRYGEATTEVGEEVAVTADGHILLAGELTGELRLRGFHLQDRVGDIFVTRLTPGPAPTHEWAVALGGDAVEQCQGMAVHSDGSVHVLGWWTGISDVEGTSMTAQAYDAWVAALVR